MKSIKSITVLAAGVLVAVAGCSSSSDASSDQVTPESVCAQIEEAGIGSNCVQGEGTGLNIAATDVWDFDLTSVPGEGGGIMLFDDADKYRRTVQAYADAEFLTGPHRYGSDSALIFVQMNEGLPADQGAKVKEIVGAL